MSWGIELWDQYDNIGAHTQNGIDFCDRYSRFTKERCAIENEYAAKLKKLVKNYQPRKKSEDAENEFTCNRGFQKMISEIHDMAGQHEDIAERLSAQVLKELTHSIHEVRQERKKYLQDGAKQTSSLNSQLMQLERAKKQYDKSFKESEKAQELFKKADADIHLSRAEVEKAKNTMHQRQQTCEDHKSEYAQELQKTNGAQKAHYETLMPETFQQLQQMEEKRISRVAELIKKSAQIERDVQPIVNKCIEGVVKSSESISPAEDIRLVIEKYKSGFVPPGDIPFEDLSNGNIDINQSSTPGRNAYKHDTLGKGGTMSGSKGKKRGGLFGGLFSGSKGSLHGSARFKSGLRRTDEAKDDYSHLPPNQQKKKLNQKIETLRAAIGKETAERDGMLKMRDVYVQNPALGDPTSLDKQLEENARKLDSLRQEMQKYEGYLAEADNKNVAQQQDSGVSVSSRASNLSISSSGQGSNPGTPVTSHHSSAKEPVVDNRASNHSSASIAKDDSFDDIDADDDDDFIVIGTCRALYSFDAPNEGSITMVEGEEYQIVEQDQGDGWTRVRKAGGEDEGFVPTSYIDVSLYET